MSRRLGQRPQILQLAEEPRSEAIERRSHLVLGLTNEHEIEHTHQNPGMLQRLHASVPLWP